MSNWAKYEIRDEEEEGEEAEERTGPEFEYVISTAQGAESHFKFKQEQEWEKQAGKWCRSKLWNIIIIKLFFQKVWEICPQNSSH